MEYRQITVQVPATTANMGPGFDCLGMALDLKNIVRMRVSSSNEVVVQGEGESTLKRDENNLVFQSAQAVFHETGKTVSALSIVCENAIPLARGLGSSAAAIVGGMVAANALCRHPLSSQYLLQLAAKAEGHADNVAPALLGGCQVVVHDGDEVITASVPIPGDLKAVVFVPEVAMPTRKARSILTTTVSREDAVYNLGRVAMLVSALATGQLDRLGVATQDRLHQTAREGIFPAMKPIFGAAREAGALGVFLSGGGSSILALTRSGADAIGSAMSNAAEKAGVRGSLMVTAPSPRGAHVVETA